jgi:O-antigen/teichoic acid export membrane protein
VRSESDYLWYAAVSVIVTGGSNLAGFIMRKDLVGLRTTGLSLRSHVRPILVLFGTALTTYIYTYLDSVMLGFLADDKAVGLYSAASKITRSVIVVITSLSLVLVPRISFYVRNNLIDEYRKITQKSAHVILFLALPLSVGLYFLAPGIVLIFAGRQFLDAAAAIHIMAPLLVVVGISNFYSLQILYPNGQENKMLIAALCAAAIDVGLNFALIRPFGFRGTALASLGTEITTLVLFVLFTKKQYRTFRLVNRQTLTYLFASAAMGALLYSIMKFLPDPLLSIIVSSVCGVLLYAGILSCAKDPLLREILHLVKDRGISGIRSLLG